MERVVVNCEAFSLPDEEHVMAIREEAMTLLETGTEQSAASAQNVLAQAKQIEARREELGPTEEILELSDDEAAQYEADQEEGELAAQVSRRAQRNTRLAVSDWTQAVDASLTDEQRLAWRAYRQALRDLTFDAEPDWPDPPS